MNNPFTITGFADEIGPSLSYQMDVLDELGIKHIEFRAAEGKNVMAFTDEEAESAAAAMKERGFAVSALGSPIGKYDIDKPFEPHYDDFLRALDLADILGTKYIRMFSFFIPEGKDPADFRDEVFKRTEAFIKKASERGIVLLHENERYIYGDNVERSLDLMKNFYCDNYRFTFDPGNFIHCDEEVFPYAYETLRPYIAYMHVKDAKYAKHDRVRDMGFEGVDDSHRPAGYGDGCWSLLIRALYESEYEGFLSVEPHLTNFAGVPGGGKEKFTAAARAIQTIVKNTVK